MQSDLPTNLIAVAPMMAWTDRHCRYLHRLYTPSALLFTEMVTTGALLHGERWEQLDYNPEEHPVALQLGGNEPEALAVCARRAAERGYDEINLNVGCPSDRVQKGAFGACLMLQGSLVADCVAAMQDAVDIPVTVKCRLGVDEHDSDALLADFVGTLTDVRLTRLYLHMRKAILSGLSPAQNREIPPLQPERAKRLKAAFPDLELVVNGGLTTTEQITEYLKWADGVMIGRAAYHNPDILSACETTFLSGRPAPHKAALLERYRDYMARQLAAGEALQPMTRHVLSSCNGLPGARRFRRILSDSRRLKEGDLAIFDEACAAIFRRAA